MKLIRVIVLLLPLCGLRAQPPQDDLTKIVKMLLRANDQACGIPITGQNHSAAFLAWFGSSDSAGFSNGYCTGAVYQLLGLTEHTGTPANVQQAITNLKTHAGAIQLNPDEKPVVEGSVRLIASYADILIKYLQNGRKL